MVRHGSNFRDERLNACALLWRVRLLGELVLARVRRQSPRVRKDESCLCHPVGLKR